MQDILVSAIGLDVHRDVIAACCLHGRIESEPEAEHRTFSTLAPGMCEMRKWIESTGCRYVAMESTGIYWHPVYDALEPCFGGEINILVVNARHIKNVPGRKTDMRDAQWIATLLRAGLLRGSFIPDRAFRDMRQLTRYRKSIVNDINKQKNRIDKYLQSSGFRFSTFLSDIFGISGRNIIRHLIANGSITREALDKCLKRKLRLKFEDILVSLNGSLSAHQRLCLSRMFTHLECIESHLAEVEADIKDAIAPYKEYLELLTTIPGVNMVSASAILAEIGIDMDQFPNSQHFCSWAGLSPGNNKSAARQKSTRINQGNIYLKEMLCEIGWVIAAHRNYPLSGWYWSVKQRRGGKRAVIAVARKILALIYIMLKRKTPYDASHFEARKRQNDDRRARRMVNELRKLGYAITAPTA